MNLHTMINNYYPLTVHMQSHDSRNSHNNVASTIIIVARFQNYSIDYLIYLFSQVHISQDMWIMRKEFEMNFHSPSFTRS